MTDDFSDDVESIIANMAETAGDGPSRGQSAADIVTNPGAGDLETPGSLQDILETVPHGGGMPTPEDMAATNASNAAAREAAIKDGMDAQTAQIVYPDFDTPEDMLRIN